MAQSHLTLRVREADATAIAAIRTRYPWLDQSAAIRFALQLAARPPSWWQVRRRRIARRIARWALAVAGAQPRPGPDLRTSSGRKPQRHGTATAAMTDQR